MNSTTLNPTRPMSRIRKSFGTRLGAFGATVVLSLGVAGPLLQQCAPATAPPANGPAHPPGTPQAEVIRLANIERTNRGLPALQGSRQLEVAARVHSNDQAAHQRMSHTGTDGSNAGQRIARTGFAYRTWGENVAYGYTSAASVMGGWMGSSGHRANILSPNFTHIGVAVATATNGQKYWTMVLAAY